MHRSNSIATPKESALDSDLPAPDDMRERVSSLEKGLAVIAAFDRERRRMTMAEIAAVCGLSRAAARRYLLTLQDLGFVTKDRNMYALTAKVLRLGQSYMYSARLPRLVDPELQRMARDARLASSAGVLDGADVMCIAATMTGPVISMTLQPGTRVPAHCAANGRVLLAGLSRAELDLWLENHSLSPKTSRTIVEPARFVEAIDTARSQGWCLVDRELEDKLLTLSVPLCNHAGDTVAAINLSADATRLDGARLVEEGLPRLLKTQEALRRLL